MPDSREGEDAIEIDWLQFSVSKDIGKNEHTVTNITKELRALNAKRPAHMRKSPDEVTEKLLRMLVACSSSAVGTEAQKELEAVAGIAGGPGVRQYQNPAAAAGNTRHHAPLVSHFQKLWSSAYRAGHISMQRATAPRLVGRRAQPLRMPSPAASVAKELSGGEAVVVDHMDDLALRRLQTLGQAG